MKLKIELTEEDCEFLENQIAKKYCDFIGRQCDFTNTTLCPYYKEKFIKNSLTFQETQQIVKNNKNKDNLIYELLDEASFKRG